VPSAKALIAQPGVTEAGRVGGRVRSITRKNIRQGKEAMRPG